MERKSGKPRVVGFEECKAKRFLDDLMPDIDEIPIGRSSIEGILLDAISDAFGSQLVAFVDRFGIPDEDKQAELLAFLFDCILYEWLQAPVLGLLIKSLEVET